MSTTTVFVNHDLLYLVSAIAVIAFVTVMTRALPFLLFGNRPLPEWATYLGKVLPPAIMVILVIYCLKGIQLFTAPFGLPEILACVAITLIHLWRNNMYLSIVVGTILYMVLLRIL